MAAGKEIAQISPKYLGTPYSRMDCQAFVEKCLSDCGINKNLAGSNAWYRFLMKDGWVGTPEETTALFGQIPVGAFLFILERDGREPAKYQGDGIGNVSHIGLYTAMTGYEMVRIAENAGVIDAARYNYGNGAINSSSSRGAVATSKFAGKSINGGWNRVGLWKIIDYGEKVNAILNGGSSSVGGGKGESMFATVVLPTGASGPTVNMRASTAMRDNKPIGVLIDRVPVGATVEVLSDVGQWCQIMYNGLTGWMMSNYLEYSGQGGESGGDVVTVAERLTIETALNEIEKQMEIIRETLGRG